MIGARRSALVIAVLLSSSHAYADRKDATAEASYDLEPQISQEATSARRARLAAAGVVLTLGGVATGVAAFDALMESKRSADPNVTVHHDEATYVLLGSGLVSIAMGVFALAVDTPQERVYAATRHASASEQRQAIAIEAHAVEHRRSVMRGVGIGFLAASAGAFIAFAATGHDVDSTAGKALVFGGTCGGTLGLGLTLTSFVHSPVEEMNDDLSNAEMMRSASQPRVSAGVVPTHGGALLGFGAMF